MLSVPMVPTEVQASADEETLFEGKPATLPSIGAWLVAILTLGIAMLYFLARSAAVSYKVTTRRVIVERGLLSKRLEQVDVYRIRDFVVERPFGQRLVGTGNIQLLTADATTPAIELRDLHTDVVALYENLRGAADADRARRGVRVIDNE